MGEAIRKLYYAVFIDGFLYVFGLSENPFIDKLQAIKGRTDSQALADDWARVGADFRKAFDKSVENVKPSF